VLDRREQQWPRAGGHTCVGVRTRGTLQARGTAACYKWLRRALHGAIPHGTLRKPGSPVLAYAATVSSHLATGASLPFFLSFLPPSTWRTREHDVGVQQRRQGRVARGDALRRDSRGQWLGGGAAARSVCPPVPAPPFRSPRHVLATHTRFGAHAPQTHPCTRTCTPRLRPLPRVPFTSTRQSQPAARAYLHHRLRHARLLQRHIRGAEEQLGDHEALVVENQHLVGLGNT
jgi:hypothetical protein